MSAKANLGSSSQFILLTYLLLGKKKMAQILKRPFFSLVPPLQSPPLPFCFLLFFTVYFPLPFTAPPAFPTLTSIPSLLL